VVLMPVLAPGRSDPHLAFPGTVSLPEEVFQGVLKAYVEAFERIGIRRVAIVSGHGSNYPSLGSFVKAYRATEGGTEVIAHDTMEGLLGFLTAGARAAGLEPLASDAHAGLVETSLALHLFDRGQVRDFSAVEGWATTDPDWVERLMSEGLENVSPSGVLGNPAGADATAGATIFEAGADGFADWICSAFGLERVSG
jgi:creatinine amidohydrolase